MDTTGTECVRALMTTSRHLIELFIQVFGELQFFLVFGVATSISFLLSKRSQPYIISSNKPSYGAVISDQHLYLWCSHMAQIWLVLLLWVFFLSSTLNAYCMCNGNSVTVGMEGLPTNHVQFMACIVGNYVAIRLERSESSFVRSTVSKSKNISTFRDIHHV